MSAAAHRGCCVLTFHRIVDAPERDHDVSRRSFDALLDRLAAAEASFTTELARPGDHALALTFDDGSADHLEVAEKLAARDVHAVFFVPSASLGRPTTLSADGCRELVALGHAVGSHARDHAPLARLPSAELRAQVEESKARLEDVCETSVSTFAPPGGVGHPALAAELERAGYEASRGMSWGFYRSPEQRWRVSCLPVTEFTLRRGWIDAAVARWSLPAAMRVGSAVRRIVPAPAAARLRGRLHAAA
jgi:peptidoglycan/xylan/chitin deacetylase (PgdA/CDA1 family)